jgi:capsular polysaccharide biosynthesis protein
MVEQPASRNGTSTNPRLPEPQPDPPVDVRGVLDAVRRDRWLIAGFVVIVTAIVLVLSMLAPKQYRATARIADDPVALDAVDPATADRQLATSGELVTAPTILNGAAKRVQGETGDSLAGKVSASVDPTASILSVTATDANPKHAADIANAVANTFLAERQRTQREVLTQARERLTNEVERQRELGATTATVNALRDRLGDLAASEALAGSSLGLAEPATAPTAAFTPKPIRSAMLALLAALLVAVLFAVARDRFRRQAPDARALSRAAGLPLIAALPIGARRLGGQRAGEADPIEEAALQAAVREALPPRVQRVVLVQGADADGSARNVAVALARSLSWAGYPSVLVQLDAETEEIEEELLELKRSDVRYVIVESPHDVPANTLQELAGRTTAVVIAARLGTATTADAASARRMMDALGLHGLGLVVTYSADDRGSVPRSAFGAPLRPRGRTPKTTNSRPTDDATDEQLAARTVGE